MTKRPNLFEENCPLQQKMHIGAKEVDCGVENGHRMQLVYERTRTLLFEGVQRSSQSIAVPSARAVVQECNCQGRSTCSSTTAVTSDDPTVSTGVRTRPSLDQPAAVTRNAFKQLRLDSFTRSHINQHQFAVVPDQLPSNAALSSCPSCRRATSSVQLKCSFCDKATCDGCLQRCGSCHCDFCSLCSFKLYDQRDDAAICLSCSSV